MLPLCHVGASKVRKFQIAQGAQGVVPANRAPQEDLTSSGSVAHFARSMARAVEWPLALLSTPRAIRRQCVV